MSSWLRNRNKDEDAPEKILRPEVEALLPSSMRQPEVNRLTPLGTDLPDDVDDKDLDFLAGLAAEVDRAAAPNAAVTLAPAPLRGASPRIDDMQVFREMKDEGKQAIRFDHEVRDIDMGDLLEELATVQAALRRRKAA